MSADIFRNISKEGGFNIIVEHVPTGTTVEFPGFVTSYSDSFRASWNSVEVYGRMDYIKSYQRTGRTINIQFDVLSDNMVIAEKNMQGFALLSRMMYPKYSQIDNSETMALAAPPLLKIKYANLISDPEGGPLLFAADTCDFSPDKDYGFFTPSDKSGVIYAKKYSLTLGGDVLHTHKIGWDSSNEWMGGSSFPHNVDPAVQREVTTTSPGTTGEADTSQSVSESRIGAITDG
jgi:hypothetical protein